jgi:serine/threonine protein kinase
MATKKTFKLISDSDLQLGDRIPGTNNKVFVGTLNGKSVAAKGTFDSGFDRAESEAEHLSILDHPNIVELIGLSKKDGVAYVVLERALGHVSVEKLSTDFPGRRSQRNRALKVIDICLQVGAGLSYIHKKGIIHRDIKPRNILEFAGGVYKICDFDIAKRLSSEIDDTQETGRFTCGYASPEAITKGIISSASDMYSFGATMCELFTGANHWGMKSPSDIVDCVKEGCQRDGSDNVWPQVVPAAIKKMVKELLKYSSERDSIEQVMKVLEAAKAELNGMPAVDEEECSLMTMGNTEKLIPGWLNCFNSWTTVEGIRCIKQLALPTERDDIKRRVDTWQGTIKRTLKQHDGTSHGCSLSCALHMYTTEGDVCYVVNAVLSKPDSTKDMLDCIGPYANQLYRAVQELGAPYNGLAYRIVFADDITALHVSFLEPQRYFLPGSELRVFQFCSFTKSLEYIKEFNKGARQAILFKCQTLTGHDISKYSAQGRQEEEVMVLPPSFFTVIRAYRSDAVTLTVEIKQHVPLSLDKGYLTPTLRVAADDSNLTVHAVRDALVAIEPHALTPVFVVSISSAICNFPSGDDAAVKALLGTAAVRDTLVAMSAHAVTADALRSLSEAICKITGGDDEYVKALFLTATARNALVEMSQHATTPEAVRWLSGATSNIACGVDAKVKALFGTEAVRDALVAMSSHAKTSDAVRWLASAFSNIACGDDATVKALFGTEAVRDTLVAISSHAKTSDAVRWLASAFSNIARGDDATVKALFGTKAVRNALVAMSSHAQTSDAVRWLSEAICKIARGDDARVKSGLFGTEDVRDALVAMSSHAKTSDAVRWISEAICKIARGDDARVKSGLFGTEDVRDALVAMSSHAKTSDAVGSLSEAICKIAGGDDAKVKALFGTEAVRDALVAMSSHAKTSDAVGSLSEAICKIAGGDDAKVKALFGTEAVRDALVAMSSHAKTSDAVRWLSTAICKITYGDDTSVEALFAATKVRSAFMAFWIKPIVWIADAFDLKVTVNDAAAVNAVFRTSAVRNALVAMSSHAQTSDAVRWLSTALCKITHGGDAAVKALFATADVRNALVAMSRHATTPEAFQWLSQCRSTLMPLAR